MRKILGGILIFWGINNPLITLADTSNETLIDNVRLTNGEWRPHMSEYLNEFGYASNIVKAAFEAVDTKVKWGFFPWKRSYSLAEKGIWDGSVVWMKSDERIKHFFFSDPVIVDDAYVYSRQDNRIEWEVIQDLRPYTFALTLHTIYPGIEKEIESGELRATRTGNYESLFPRLMGDRSDGTILTESVANYFLRQNHIWADKIYRDNTVLYKRSYHLMISRNIKDGELLIKRFNTGLQIIKDNGVWEQLLNNLNNGFYDNE